MEFARQTIEINGCKLSLARGGKGAPLIYLHGTDGHEDIVSQRIEDALAADASSASSSRCVKASGSAHRRSARDPVRYLSVNRALVPRIAHARRARPARTTACRWHSHRRSLSSEGI